MSEKVKIETTIKSKVPKVWEMLNDPEHIMKWNHASDDWHSPRADNDIRVGGKFNYRMEAKDGSGGFDFTGVYTEVVPHSKIAFTMDDGRKVEIIIDDLGDETKITEIFEAENENPVEFQRAGWQAILDNFKTYVESH